MHPADELPADTAHGYTRPSWDWANTALIAVFRIVLAVISRRRYAGLHHLPAAGGVVIVSNHLSLTDPLVLAHAVRRAGRTPRGMGKAELFRLPLLGRALQRMGHIPVDRAGARPAAALEPAAAALRAGEVICLYPEGTTNRDPDAGLVHAKTGAVRLALQAGVPIVPVGQWGPQHALRGGRVALLRAPRLFGWFRRDRLPRRPRCTLVMGAPIGHAELLRAATAADGSMDYRAATTFVMGRIAELVVSITGQPQAGVLDGGVPAFQHRRAAA